MPQIGEIKGGKQIGKRSTNSFIWVECPNCHRGRWVALSKYHHNISKICRQCFAPGRYKDMAGYVHIVLYPDDFFYPMANKAGHVLEHRLVIAKHLGRCLQPWENVHHKDGKREHNNLSNLILTTTHGHLKGYRAGYRQGYADCARIKNENLEKQIRVLRFQNSEILKLLQLKLGEGIEK